MKCTKHEEYLLKFISCKKQNSELFEFMRKFGLKPKFQDFNPIYQIIDELNYSDYFASGRSL